MDLCLRSPLQVLLKGRRGAALRSWEEVGQGAMRPDKGASAEQVTGSVWALIHRDDQLDDTIVLLRLNVLFRMPLHLEQMF